MSQREIAKYYNVDRRTIQRRMKKFNISARTYMEKIQISEHELRHLYKDVKMTQQEIADYYGTSRGLIQDRMKEYDIDPRQLSEAGRKYSINEDFFKIWTSESAWLYGWALGDGSFNASNILRFGLSVKDKEVLYKFRAVLDSTHPVKDRIIRGYNGYRDSEASCIQFSSIKLVNDLRKLCYHDVPIKYFAHFLRGFFEAEGSIG